MKYTSDWEIPPETMDQMIKRRVIDILNDVDDTIEVGMDDDLQQAGFDSLDMVDISMEIEKQFSIYIFDDELFDNRSPYTLRRIIEFVKNKISETTKR